MISGPKSGDISILYVATDLGHPVGSKMIFLWSLIVPSTFCIQKFWVVFVVFVVDVFVIVIVIVNVVAIVVNVIVNDVVVVVVIVIVMLRYGCLGAIRF